MVGQNVGLESVASAYVDGPWSVVQANFGSFGSLRALVEGLNEKVKPEALNPRGWIGQLVQARIKTFRQLRGAGGRSARLHLVHHVSKGDLSFRGCNGG